MMVRERFKTPAEICTLVLWLALLVASLLLLTFGSQVWKVSAIACIVFFHVLLVVTNSITAGVALLGIVIFLVIGTAIELLLPGTGNTVWAVIITLLAPLSSVFIDLLIKRSRRKKRKEKNEKRK